MSTQGQIQNGGTERIELFATDATAGVTGLTFTLKIVRLDNGQFWNGSAFQAGSTTVSMTQSDSTNRPGWYHYDFTPNVSDILCSFYASTASTSVSAQQYAGFLKVGDVTDSTERNKIADHTLRRNYASARASSSGDSIANRCLLWVIAKLANRVKINTSTNKIEAYHEDDTTQYFTQSLTNDSSAQPITEIDTD